ncbi:MAG: YqjF family protein [Longimicrobiales bacterium]
MNKGEANRILADSAHRPWPVPQEPWLIWQDWEDVGFANWPVPVERLRPLVPPELEIDTFDGLAWITLTPLRVRIRPRTLRLPLGVLDFPELNLRTYVRVRDRPGIFFFSLDAGSRLAVAGARTLYRLPYYTAEMRMTRSDGRVSFRSRREDGAARLVASYVLDGEARAAAPGTREHWLAERYALYVVLRSGRVHRTDIHHRPWLLQPARFDIETNTVGETAGIALTGEPQACMYAAQQKVLTWGPRAVGEPARTAA